MDIFQAIRRDGEAAVGQLTKVPDINVNAADSKGQTPLHYAATYRNSDVAEQLLSNGADIALTDAHGNTALWTAVFNARGEFGIVEAFLRHNGRQFAALKNKHGKSPLDFAKQIGDKALVALLEG